jgi:ubiquinone/menaquinone biosynthesis C-methylase UbiE
VEKGFERAFPTGGMMMTRFDHQDWHLSSVNTKAAQSTIALVEFHYHQPKAGNIAMSQKHKPAPATSHRIFAAYYERMSGGTAEKSYMEPLRKEMVGQATGLVLEVGAGNGLNFAFFDPQHVERVEAIEPNSAMLDYARKRATTAPVPVTLTRASVEQLPFADAYFDSVVCTLVFCSVNDPLRGLQEILRVLKPGGQFLMVEHVRAQGHITAFVQDLLTPFTRLFVGNCHWNRRTEQTVHEAGFQEVKLERRVLVGGLLPVLILVARR